MKVDRERACERISKLRIEYDDLLEQLDAKYEATSEVSHQMVLIERRLAKISTRLDPISGVQDGLLFALIVKESITIHAELMRIKHLYI